METNLVAIEKEVREIERLYGEYTRMSIEKAAEMGKHLITVKEMVGHGNFGVWIDNNLPFSWQSAAKYMTVYKMSIREEGLDPSLTIEEVYEEGKKMKLIPHIQPEKVKEPTKSEPLPVRLQPPIVEKPEMQVVEKSEEQPKFKVTLNLKPEKVEEAEIVEDDQGATIVIIKEEYMKLDEEHKEEIFLWIMNSPPKKWVEKEAA